jgi:nucleotide-binding universal stress UspA family protein
MFENVLVGVDGRSGGRDAIALAPRLTGPEGELTLVNVHGGSRGASHMVTPRQLRREREASQDLLERERAAAALDAKLLSLAGASPAHALHEHAKDCRADLLVVGSCSRGLIDRAILGSDTSSALSGAPCALAIASPGYAEHPMPLAKIGVGYDGSPESKLALQAGRELGSATRASVEALKVVSPPTYGWYTGIIPPLTGEGVDVMLQEARKRMQRLPDVDGRAVRGPVGEELAAFADSVDLLIVGSRDHGPMKRLVLGSISHYLERHAHCSLLILPHELLPASRPAQPTTAPEA